MLKTYNEGLHLRGLTIDDCLRWNNSHNVAQCLQMIDKEPHLKPDLSSLVIEITPKILLKTNKIYF